MVKRVCQIIKIKPECLEEYKRLHADAWPSVLLALEKAHFAEYSIHYDPLHDLLIAHWNYTGNDFDGDMAEVAKDPVTQKWWTVTDALQESLVPNATGSGKGAWWLNLEEVFYFNP